MKIAHLVVKLLCVVSFSAFGVVHDVALSFQDRPDHEIIKKAFFETRSRVLALCDFFEQSFTDKERQAVEADLKKFLDKYNWKALRSINVKRATLELKIYLDDASSPRSNEALRRCAINFLTVLEDEVFTTIDFEFLPRYESFIQRFYYSLKPYYDSACLLPLQMYCFEAAIENSVFRFRIDTDSLLSIERIWNKLQAFLDFKYFDRFSLNDSVKILLLDSFLDARVLSPESRSLLNPLKAFVVRLKVSITKPFRRIDLPALTKESFVRSILVLPKDDQLKVLGCWQYILSYAQPVEIGQLGVYDSAEACRLDGERLLAGDCPAGVAIPSRRKRNRGKKHSVSVSSGAGILALVAAGGCLGDSDSEEPACVSCGTGSAVSFDSQSLSPESVREGEGRKLFVDEVVPFVLSPPAVVTFDAQLQPRKERLLSLVARNEFPQDEDLDDNEVFDMLDEFECAEELMFLKQLLSVLPEAERLCYFKKYTKIADLESFLRAKEGDQVRILSLGFSCCADLRKRVCALTERSREFGLRGDFVSQVKVLTMHLKNIKGRLCELLYVVSEDEWREFCRQRGAKCNLSAPVVRAFLLVSLGVGLEKAESV